MEPNNTSSDKKSHLEESQSEQSPMEQLFAKIAQGFANEEIEFDIIENDKISDALTDFIEPYLYDGNDEDLGILLDVATFAWNLSFFSKKVAQKEIESTLEDEEMMPANTDQETKEHLKRILGQMIARKKRHFSKYKRLILDYELGTEDDSYYLNVISAPAK